MYVTGCGAIPSLDSWKVPVHHRGAGASCIIILQQHQQPRVLRQMVTSAQTIWPILDTLKETHMLQNMFIDPIHLIIIKHPTNGPTYSCKSPSY